MSAAFDSAKLHKLASRWWMPRRACVLILEAAQTIDHLRDELLSAETATVSMCPKCSGSYQSAPAPKMKRRSGSRS